MEVCGCGCGWVRVVFRPGSGEGYFRQRERQAKKAPLSQHQLTTWAKHWSGQSGV